MHSAYEQTFDNMCFVSIPAKVHGFTHNLLEVIVFDKNVPSKIVASTPSKLFNISQAITGFGLIGQDPQSYDIEIVFPTARSGRVLIREGETPLISQINYLRKDF